MSPTIRHDEPAEELEDVRAGRLPARYDHRMQDVFLDRLAPYLVPGVRILDVGAGRAPTLAPEDRPAGVRYVGTDISQAELDAAPAGAYDLAVAADITTPLPFDERFDLVLSWQVLEHVSSVRGALDTIHAVLAPGGTVLAHFSGDRAAFALLSRLMPHTLRVLAMQRLLGMHAEEKFPTAFDHCHASQLQAMLAGWQKHQLVAFYRAAPYFGFSRPLQRAYLRFEDTIARHDVRNLATHYLLVATRAK